MEESKDRNAPEEREEEPYVSVDENIETDVPPYIQEQSLEQLQDEDLVEEDLAPEQAFDTQHTEGHTYNPTHAADQGLTYTPPSDPPVVPSHDDPQGAEIAAGFAQSMEETDPDVRDLPPRVDNEDLDLEEDVRQALRYNSETAHLTDIQVEVDQGVVTLKGNVLNENDIALAFDIVNDLPGVVEVRSELEIAL